MSTSIDEVPPIRDERAGVSQAETPDTTWNAVYRVGGAAALLSLVCIVVAGVVFLISPPPSTVTDWFALFHRSGLLGVLDLDLMMMVSYALVGVIYLTLFGALRRTNEPFMALAAVCGFVSIATYFASNPAFNMLSLSSQYADATTGAERSQLLGAGQAALAMWQGSAFDVSYALAAIAAIIIAVVMLHGSIFTPATGYVGLLMGILTLVPATAGKVGLVLSFVSLMPLVVWLILIAQRLFQLSTTSRHI